MSGVGRFEYPFPGQQRSGYDGDEDDSAAGSGHVTGEWLARKPVVAEYPISIKICISPLGLKYLIHCCGSPPSPIFLAKHILLLMSACPF